MCNQTDWINDEDPFLFLEAEVQEVQQILAEEFLLEARNTMLDRARQYDTTGKPERSMANVVAMFNILHEQNLTEAQGWSFMELLKMVRSFKKTPFNEAKADSIIDGISYTSLRGEAQSKEPI